MIGGNGSIRPSQFSSTSLPIISASAGPDRGVGVVAVLRARRAVAVAVGVDGVDAGAVLVDPVVRDVGGARAGSWAACRRSRRARRTPSPSASPSTCSHETRVSASSVIAVSSPLPQSTRSARPSRAMMLSFPGPPLNVSIPPPPNSPSLPSPPLKMTGSVDAGVDRGDVVAVAEARARSRVTPRLRAVDRLRRFVAQRAARRPARCVGAAEAGEADRVADVEAGDLVAVAVRRRRRRSLRAGRSRTSRRCAMRRREQRAAARRGSGARLSTSGSGSRPGARHVTVARRQLAVLDRVRERPPGGLGRRDLRPSASLRDAASRAAAGACRA